ncbi:hypothetical protein DH2020_023015 [Rehmannia glutinosa]|uniref:Transmembrane protein n=1 Tax=Rehmannia glutinosa TaxID=99300 RepID=A0ABR0W4U6_REHGL
MALAEARAAWQRTANRCLVQEDAKRAPKLACCSSVTPSVKQAETGPPSVDSSGQDNNPTAGSLPFNRNPSYSNLSPNSRWWLQMQPNYGFQKGLVDEHFTSSEGKNETFQVQESGEENDFKDIEGKYRSSHDRNCQDILKREFKEDVGELRDAGTVKCEVSKSADDLYFDSESSWIGAEKNTPWWRTADTEELALLVAQRSLDLLENCDLPRPQSTHVKKDTSVNICHSSHDEISTSLLVRKPGFGSHVCARDSKSASPIAGNLRWKLRKSAEHQLVLGADKPLRDTPTYERMPEMHALEDDASRAQLLEALRHSQTRAREAEQAAKQACAEKEHIVKLVLRQASQIFAYKQWLQLLQLENMYFQFQNSKSESVCTADVPVISTRKTRKGWRNRKREKRARPRCDVGKYAIVFALGLGLGGAGLLLGWTIGWMLPTW